MAVRKRAKTRRTSLAGQPASWAERDAERLSAAVKIVSGPGAGRASEYMSRRAASLVEMGGRAVTRFIGAETILLDLTADETRLAVDGLKEGLRMRPAAAAIADLVPMGVATYVAMGKSFLEDTDQQNRELVESYAEGRPLAIGERLKKFGRQRVICFVENQKKYLDEISEQVTIATRNREEAPKAMRARSQVFIHVARESMDKVIDAERKILHLAMPQPEASETHPRTSFAEPTRNTRMNGAVEVRLKTRKAPRRAAKPKK